VAEYVWESAEADNAGLYSEIVEGELLHAIVVADDAFGEKLGKAIKQVRPEVNVVVIDEVGGLPAALAGATLDRRTHVIYAPDGAADDVDAEACGFYEKALVLMQQLVAAEAICNLFILTETATHTADEKALNLLHAPLFAMARVYRNEYPNLPVRVIDLDNREAVPVNVLASEIMRKYAKNYESEVAIRAGERFVRKLKFVDAERVTETQSMVLDACGSGYSAEFDKSGVIGAVSFRRGPVHSINDGQVEIHVKASAVNYKDVMNAMGLLAKRAVDGGLAADRLGLEVSGVVASVGKNVTAFSPGDEVVARVSNGFSGRCVTTPEYIAKKPSSYSFEEAAAVPVVYLTAHYGLNYLGRMEAGETVLIHSAAGGVGVAAIQLAKAAGVDIIATAGSRKKRTQLRKMYGIEHVFDSRSNAFYSDVMLVTDGRGVDLVLNSLTGKQITQSLKCLAPYGRFIEIGKTDIYGNTSISLERLGENISYHVVDVDRLAAQKPALHKRLLDEVIAIIEGKGIAAHPIISFPVTALDKALRQMTRAAHIGKFVVTMQGTVKTLPVNRYAAPRTGAIVISGGTSGLGLRLADWLSERGAEQLVLLSRSGVKSEDDQRIVDGIVGRGTHVTIEKGDVVSRDDVARVIDAAVRSAGKVSGVVHAAGVLQDALVPNMTKESFARVFDPKALGAFNLHQACADAGQRPELFLMISSMSSVLGLKGQINYASANYFEDALAEHRRAIGLPATSVNLGVLGEYAGMSMKAKDDTGVLDLLDSNGLGSMHKADVFAKIEAAVLDGGFHRLCAKIHWDAFGTAYPNLSRDTRFADVFDESASQGGGRRKRGATIRDELTELAAEQRHEFLTQKIAAAISELTGMPIGSVSTDESMDKWSLDSIMLGQIAAWILKNTEINYPLIKLVKGPTLEEIAAELLAQMQHGESDLTAESESSAAKDDGSLLLEMGAESLSKWIIRGCSNGDEKKRVICFHSMGVGASLFTHFLLNPLEGVDVLAIQSPGRENRKNEPFIQSVDEIVDNVVREIRPYIDDSYIIWGHSFGGIVAFETIRRLREEGLKLPYHFMLTATIAPHLVKVWQNRDVLLRVMIEENRAEYLIALSRYIEDPEFIERILPVMRRDMPILQTYKYSEGENIDIPITAWAAHQDDMVYFDEVEQWRQHTNSHFDINAVDGDHWFLNSNKDAILNRMAAILNGEKGA
jgi:NADPH:quinone reductase-like Zn-dependent oxidoreductase/surfactin synthase thioesterase subunit